MDAHFMRRLALELVPLLNGARVEKIFHPAENIDTLVLFTAGAKHNLVLRIGRSFPFLFTSSLKPDNPAQPPAGTMRLRKYLRNRRITAVLTDWPTRRMALGFGSGDYPWLILDMRTGLELVRHLPEGFGTEPVWPDAHEWPRLLESLSEAAPCADLPMLTPALRRTLMHMDMPDAHALMLDLEAAFAGDIFVYHDSDGTPVTVSAWPLATEQCRGLTEMVMESALKAARLVGEAKLYKDMSDVVRLEEHKKIKAGTKRIDNALKRLAQEEQRMLSLIAQQQDALALQSVLYRFGPEERLKSVEVNVDTQEADAGKSTWTILLDGTVSVRDNMNAMFARAAKGKRGLLALASRKVDLLADRGRVEQGAEAQSIRKAPAQTFVKKTSQKVTPKSRTSIDNNLVLRFQSSDGFLMIRGRNAKGNDVVVRQASTFDLWFHAQDGPSAHLVIRLDYPGQEIPEQTMLEAAALTAVRSWQRDDATVRIMCAWVKDVRKIKGAKAGAVRVDTMERSMIVAPDERLEETLRILS
ncbi:NFACT RNA binding domain-containing protein [Oleidesulfovibrio sp.]|uniref:NFACT RNA binding domain-containing protein n=1 Tax=Oleidesulfovibrio sp. TaxID=2909707 RepID=UPI003A875FD9